MMMKFEGFKKGRTAILAFLLIVLTGSYAAAQTCTVTSSQNWVNPGPACSEGGNAGSQSIIVIPAGITVTFDDNGDTWSGTRIEVYGTLAISAPGQVTITANVDVKNGGLLDIGSKLNLGSSSGCGETLVVRSGGTVNIVGSTPDRLNVCGVEIARGGSAGCNPFPAGPLPYCEPGGGFVGPVGLDQNGVNATLPIKLSYFKVELVNETVQLNWATEKEEDFDHFEVQRAGTDLKFSTIASVQGAGYNTSSLEKYDAVDEAPLVGTNYYRLKAVDVDGSIEYFVVKSINYTGGKKFYVSPNPTSGEKIKFITNFEPSENDQVVLIDAVGNVVGSVAVLKSDFEIIPTKTLPPGVYLLRYNSTNYKGIARVLVKE